MPVALHRYIDLFPPSLQWVSWPPLAGALRFPTFIGVGSEEARLRAGLRPPLKLPVRFSRRQLSRRRAFLRCNRRNQSNQIYQPVGGEMIIKRRPESGIRRCK